MKTAAEIATTKVPSMVVVSVVFLLLIFLAIASSPIWYQRTDMGMGMSPKQAESQISTFATALAMFKVDNGDYPKGTNGLNDLVIQPSGATKRVQYMESIPLDPWQHPYIYECPGKHNLSSFDLSSAGPDGRQGTDDDITNWKTSK